MSEIVPCVTVETEEAYIKYAQAISPFARRVHIDISDGELAPTHLMGIDKLRWPGGWIADIHAMVARPSEYVNHLITLKPHLIIFHAEVQEDLLPILQHVKQSGIKAGIALQRPTVPASVQALIEAVDHVMIFSGDLGHYGGTASLMQLEKVRIIRTMKPDIEIGWDGGVTAENAFSISHGGVDVLNAGGFIAKAADPTEAYNTLVNEINKKGVI